MKWYEKLFSRVRALKIFRNKKADLTAGGIASLSIALLIAAILVPIGLLEIADANTTGWNAAVITVFQVALPILFVVGLALRTIPGKRK